MKHGCTTGRTGMVGLALAGLTLASLLPASTVLGQAAAPTTSAASSGAPLPRTPEQKRELVTNHLNKEYTRVLESRDWMSRALALVCLSRVPGEQPTETLLSIMKRDSMPVVRVIAWQCVASRAKGLTPDQFKRWSSGTWDMYDQGCFRGDLRAGLLDVMAASPPDARAKQVWQKIFATTSLQPPAPAPAPKGPNSVSQGPGSLQMGRDDLGIIRRLGECLARWRSPDLVEMLITRMQNLNDAERAETVLRIACGDLPRGWTTRSGHRWELTADPPAEAAPPAGDSGISEVAWADTRHKEGSAAMWSKAINEYVAWWKKHKNEWVEWKKDVQAWRALESLYVPTADLGPMDTSDRKWTRDLELGSPNLQSLTVCFLVDATGSMQCGIDWVKGDLARMMSAFSLVCKEPRVGVTFYRDNGDEFVTKPLPMVGKERLDQLVAAVAQVKAKGGDDEPEAILEGLQAVLTQYQWPQTERSKKIVILLGDAPAHPETQAACEKLVSDAAAKGYRFYSMKLVTGWEALDLSTFDKFAELGKGSSMALSFHGVPPRRGGGGWGEAQWRDDEQQRQAGLGFDPCVELLTRVLVDAINPQFKERVEPVVRVLLAGLTDDLPPEVRRPWGPIADPPPQPVDGGGGGGGGGGGDHKKDPPPKPFNPQAR